MRRSRLVVAAATAALLVAGSGAFAGQGANQGPLTHSATSSASAVTRRVVPNSYIVTLTTKIPGQVTSIVTDLLSKYGGRRGFLYTSALHGFEVHNLTQAQAHLLGTNPLVQAIQPNYIEGADSTQTPVTYGLDRIDQRDLPLDNSYTWGPDGSGVRVYHLDSGIRLTHNDFKNGGVSRLSFGFDAIGDGQNGNDCEGHGTHTAGILGSNTFGVAKRVSIVDVRVLDCNASGSSSQIVAGLDWVSAHAIRPAVANLSLGTGIGADSAQDAAVNNLISKGVTVVVAAGNGGTIGGLLGGGVDACGSSPARVPDAITVSATDKTDKKPSYANYGTCVKIFAPGDQVESTYNSDDNASGFLSGTSQACPHVAGAAALYLSLHPSALPSEVANALTSNATLNKVTSPGSGSPNRLLYTGFMTGGNPTPTPTPTPTQTPTPTPTPTSPNPGGPQRPVLTQFSANSQVTLTVQLAPQYDGGDVIFYVRSGMTGQVRSLGRARVGQTDSGFAYRFLNMTQGQILWLYSKYLGPVDIPNRYSNDVKFKVQ